jgi:hypothetical protein
MKKLFDLRFVIGVFFAVIGVLLLVYGFVAPGGEGEYINKWCGGIFIAFGAFMLILASGKPLEE